MTREEFYLTDDGIRLHAKLDRPEGPDKTPLCIVLHGLTGHMEEPHICAVSEAMNGLGIATLRVELYGHGQSDGEFRNHDLFKWISNVLTVVDYAKSLDFVTDLYLCGHSQGGLATMLVAGMRPDSFQAILPLSPALNIPDGAKRGELRGVRFDPAHLPDMVSFHDLPLKGDYLRVAQLLDVDGAVRRYKGPVLLVHGTKDTTVPVQYSIDAAAQYENAKLVLIDGDTHCYDYHLEQVLEAVKEFLS